MDIYVPGGGSDTVYTRYSFHGDAETPSWRAVRAVRLVTWECGQRGELALNTWRAIGLHLSFTASWKMLRLEPAGILFAIPEVEQQEQHSPIKSKLIHTHILISFYSFYFTFFFLFYFNDNPPSYFKVPPLDLF